jgi:hypothetical protein
MANPFSMGLPNQALKALQSQYSSNPLQTIPVEYDVTTGALGGGAETDVISLKTVASNHKVTLDSLLVNAGHLDNIFRLYRNGVLVLSYKPNVVGQSVQVFTDGVGKEFDEAETWRVRVISAAGGVTAQASVSGRDELKRQMLYSPLLA